MATAGEGQLVSWSACGRLLHARRVLASMQVGMRQSGARTACGAWWPGRRQRAVRCSASPHAAPARLHAFFFLVGPKPPLILYKSTSLRLQQVHITINPPNQPARLNCIKRVRAPSRRPTQRRRQRARSRRRAAWWWRPMPLAAYPCWTPPQPRPPCPCATCAPSATCTWRTAACACCRCRRSQVGGGGA